MENRTPNVSRGLSGVLEDEDAAIQRGYIFWHNSNLHWDREALESAFRLDTKVSDTGITPERPLPATVDWSVPRMRFIDGSPRYYPECQLCTKSGGVLAQLGQDFRNYLRKLTGY